MTQASNSRSFWQTGAVSAGKTSKKGPNRYRRQALIAFVTLVVIGLTVLQKIALPITIGSVGGPIELVLPLTYVALFGLAFFVTFKLDLIRFGLLVVMVIFGAISTALLTVPYSLNSLLLVFAIYVPFILYVETSEKTYKNLMNIFLNVMIAMGAIVLIEQIIQLIWNWRAWPNLDSMLPKDFLLEGYVYIQAIKLGSRFMKPNGIFFLEVSCVSQWTAVALALELVYFRRLWRMIFYAVVLIACFAGTGLLLLLVTSPVLLSRLSRQSLAVVALVFAAFVITAIGIDWLPQVQQRFTEIQQYNSSSHHRFVAPFQMLFDLLQKPSSIALGAGPGNIPLVNEDIWWAITKLSYEYGFLTAVAFFVFLGYVLFKDAPSQRIAFVLIILFNFSGGTITPVYPILVFLIGGLFRFRESQSSPREAKDSRSGRASTSRAAVQMSRMAEPA
jgi:hypothetical protein